MRFDINPDLVSALCKYCYQGYNSKCSTPHDSFACCSERDDTCEPDDACLQGVLEDALVIKDERDKLALKVLRMNLG